MNNLQARIALYPQEDMTTAQHQVLAKIISGPRAKIQGPLRAALYNAELADRWQALGALLRYSTSLPARLSEIAILVTARACNSPFEWYAHRIEAEKAGLEQEIIQALLERRKPRAIQTDDLLIWQYAIELNAHHSASDQTYQATLERFGEKTIVELTALIGYYTMVAMTLNSHQIPLPEGIDAAFEWPQQAALK
jgi:4-carboxymuconolactone decarboxylase